jgi:ABC-2 type transport system permease protein
MPETQRPDISQPAPGAQFRAVLRAKLRMAGHYIASVRTESKLKIAVVSTAAVSLWVGAYFLFLWGFRELLEFGGREGAFSFGDILLNHVLGLVALAVFMLLVFSNILVAYSTLYKSRDVLYLLQGPLDFSTFFYARFVECILFSSWSLAYLGSPIILAYARSTEASPAVYIVLTLLFLPAILVPACIGACTCMLLVRIFPALNTHFLVGIGLVAVVAFYAYLRSVMAGGDGGGLELSVPSFIEAIGRTQSPLLPSHWAAQCVFNTAAGHYADALLYGLALLSTALFFLWGAGQVAKRLYYPGWSALFGHENRRAVRRGGKARSLLPRLLRHVPNPARVLLIKDLRLFWRDPTQWAQFIVFFGIMAIYIANLGQRYSNFDQPIWRGWVACLNVGALSLILSTLTSRFVFPLVSLEGRRFWILGLAPLTYRQLLWQKFWCSVATTSGFTVGLALLSGIRLQLGPLELGLTLLGIIAANFGLAGLAVGLGALYPNFQEDNPARIVSGLGGTLNLLLSVAYVAVVAGLVTAVIQGKALGLLGDPARFWAVLAGAVCGIVALSLVCALAPMRLGLGNLNRMEF